MSELARHRFSRFCALVALLLALIPLAASAKQVTGRGHALPPLPGRDLTRQEMADFADAYFAEKMAEAHIPGLTFVAVKDGGMLYAQGYGMADLERRIPVAVDKTIFHTASVAKVFTASAIMQLVEAGKIDLAADVNTYLRDFQIPATFPQPITIAHLLTHTAGFDDEVIGLGTRTEAGRTPLGQFVREHVPTRVRPPGEIYAYSNYGFALLGHVVETVSGIPYVQYLDEHVLQPLGMRRSGFKLRAENAPDMATGYRLEGETRAAMGFPYINTTPASELTATATDIARFMLAHLEGGHIGTARLLGEDTVTEMHRQHFTHHPLLPGMAFGFHEYPGAESWGLGHTGSVDGFGSVLYLLPEDKLGFFLASNLDGTEDLLTGFIGAFLDRFYPHDPASASVASAVGGIEPAPMGAAVPTDKLAGAYRRVRQSQTKFDKVGNLLGLFGSDVQVAVNPNGTLRVRDADYARIEPLAFRQVDGEGIIAFRAKADGGIGYLFIDNNAFFRTRWYDAPTLGLAVAGFALAVFLLTAIGWPLAALIRRRRGQPSPPADETATNARRLAWALCVLNLVFVIGLASALSDASSLIYGAPPSLTAALSLTWVTAILTVPVLALAGLAWKRGYWSVGGRSYYTVVAVAALAFLWFLNQWNLLGVRL